MHRITRDAILDKLEKVGAPLELHWKTYRGFNTGYNRAFVIDECKHQQLIAADSNSEELIKLAIGKPQQNRWKPELKYLIWIPSSKFKEWSWSNAVDESDAERIFAKKHPAIKDHLHRFKDGIKARNANAQKNFYWELPWYVKHIEYPEFHGPKIVLYVHPSIGLAAWYDQSCAFVLNTKVLSIPTANFSLLSILNSKLCNWYLQGKSEKENKQTIRTKDIKNFPITGTEAQKLELSRLVQQILDDPDSSKVRDIEREIDQLIFLKRLFDSIVIGVLVCLVHENVRG